MALQTCNLAVAAFLVALAAAAARPAVAGPPQYTEMFAQLNLVDGTLSQVPGSSCPFTAAQGSTPEQAACGEGGAHLPSRRSHAAAATAQNDLRLPWACSAALRPGFRVTCPCLA